jgi:hypothetical protein
MQRSASPARRLRALAVAALALLAGATSACTGLGTSTSQRHTTAAVSSGALGTRVRTTRFRDDDRRPSARDLAPSVRALKGDEVRRLLTVAEPGTYIGEVLRDRDSALTRWPDRVTRPLAIFIGNAAGRPGWDDAYRTQVAAAFQAWQEVGIPVRFTFTADSAGADIHVSWVDQFREPISGKTVWTRDDRWWIVDADILLALHHRDGSPLDTAQVRAIALHEVGHLLGLDHTSDAANIMAPRVRVRDLSAADQATVRLLYSVPAGKIR